MSGGDSGDGRLVVGLHPVRELLRAGRAVRRIAIAEGREDSEVLADIRKLAGDAGVEVRERPRRDLDEATGSLTHQGVVAWAPPFPYLGLSAFLQFVDRLTEPALLVALDGVTDPHNLGSIARTTEAIGGHALIVPARRAAGVTPAAEKAAAGALAHLPVAKVPNLAQVLKALSERNIWSVGLDASAEEPITACRILVDPLVLVIGSEGAGLARLSRVTCDVLTHLPMRGRIGSLNASVAAGIALYEVFWRRQVS
ncbi:MAG: 23S rRNA (guanosine(2251)-2'-O)-methyltransferase RlmB [Nitriliruptorales bacterium]|nr:23S rRNA (guanosine(2251)-2'-O)-methyltransferase RlmB [Nitriliruptorales bacterium]